MGNTIEIINGKGAWYEAKIVKAHPKICEFEILQHKQEKDSKHYIHVVVAPTKNTDRMEWFVEKAVELGVDELSFILCQQSERRVFKTERIQRKAISAMKQSLKLRLPKINPLVPFTDFLDNSVSSPMDRFIAYVDQENPKLLFREAIRERNYCVLIGPEGDFSKEELHMAKAQGFVKVSLGKSRLRTETAAMAACHILNLIND